MSQEHKAALKLFVGLAAFPLVMSLLQLVTGH